MRLTPETLANYMQHWSEQTRRAIHERLQTRHHQVVLSHFSEDEAEMLRAMLARMIPLPPGEEVDLVGFLDWAIDKPVGYQAETVETRPIQELIHAGIIGVQETSVREYGEAFTELTEEQQDVVLTWVQEGAVIGDVWRQVPSQEFFMQLLRNALAGYFAHPLAQIRLRLLHTRSLERYQWEDRKEHPLRRYYPEVPSFKK